MIQEFENHLEAIDWIANNTTTEAQFEIMREELNFNHIYSGEYYINPNPMDIEVVWLTDPY